LFILMRFREELRAGRDPDQAADAAMATSGLAVVLSGLTVVASLTGIYLIGTPVLRSMATGAILAVAFAVLTSATLIPAVLTLFARAAARRSALLHWSRRAESTQSRFWTRWVGMVMRRPWVSAVSAAALLLVLAAPSFGMVLGNSMQRQFPSSHEIRGGVAAAAQALGPGALGPIRILVSFPNPDANNPSNAPTLAAVARATGQAVNIVSVSPPIFGDDNRSALLSAVLAVDPEEMKARDTVDWLRATLPGIPELNAAGQAAPGAAGVRIDVGGPTALIKDFDDRVAHTQLLVFAFVSVIAFVMLLISIRSAVLALKGVLMTVLSVAAAYGSLVVVFQWGWLEKLGFEPINSIDSTIPPLVLAMTFGLSMDYEIFLLTRIRERFVQSADTRDAVAYGVATSARTITSAALIMIAVFIGFAFAGMPLVAQLGVACAVAIAVDATVVRLVLVPSLMAMFDRWNWWLPAWLDRILPAVDFDRPLPKLDVGDLVVIPDDISTLAPPPADMRVVVRNAARLKELAPQTISVIDPLAFSGCGSTCTGDPEPAAPLRLAATIGGALDRRRPRPSGAPRSAALRPVHPVTMWRGRLEVALDALEAEAVVQRRTPVETTNVQLPTGDRLQIPTAAETLRMKGFLALCRNTRTEFADLADLADAVGVDNAARVLGRIDGYYSAGRRERLWIATQLVRRLADPIPSEAADDDRWTGPDADARWDDVRQRCLSLAVAIMEEAS
jgi:RND superfamily putative drug exporter